ncbi:MAG: TraR/DksA C4-type zinc finger protein [Bacteroidia bacterium]|nr:TraR/DksA C4-type zinc finger protein [Bacteroidia bacterium]NNF31300.1 TraR/DksA family transcriptional regulator [Flavobacteriaceae bacterium]MBT8274608.1 TraR/DksA C4-type zinc finger protein [Bacteroidia bacterium]NNJ82130.1 TraR/DksA family transcriptional regulator [Flavobacteriaceae bacterium]NNK54222.1 TraR/DksA family transcriptional regulator [Flavobacteriaceae bacterium]
MKDTAQIKQRINEEIKATKELVLKYRELTKPIAPENAIGRISRMDAINNKSVNDAALRKAETKLKNLEVALSKVDDPDFGICLKCKNEIPLGRIMLLPHAVTCVNCAK